MDCIRDLDIGECKEIIKKWGFCHNDYVMGINPCFRCEDFNKCHVEWD